MNQQVKPFILGALLLLLFLTVSVAYAMNTPYLAASHYEMPAMLNTLQGPQVEIPLGIKNERVPTNVFRELAAPLVGVEHGSVAWGDYNNDSLLDLAISGWDGSNRMTKIYRNTGSSFTDSNISLGEADGALAWGDYDNDGDLDLLATGWSDSSAQIYRNDGNSFPLVAVLNAGGMASAGAWGDYDNDGDLDLVVVGSIQNIQIYRNDGSGNFEIALNLSDIGRDASVDWGDYDNDGDLDLLVAGQDFGQATTKLFRNNGGDNFTDTNAPLEGVFSGSVAWGDYDRDGDLDIALTGHTGLSPTTKVYQNNSSNFSEVASLAEVWESSVAWADYDSDGDLDLAVVGSNEAYIYRNSGGNFADIGAPIEGVYNASNRSVAWGDYDNDGDSDLVLIGRPRSISPNAAKIYRNDKPIVNSPTPIRATNTPIRATNTPIRATNTPIRPTNTPRPSATHTATRIATVTASPTIFIPTRTATPTRTPTSPPNSLNLNINHIEISQAVQRPDNSVPLVTNRPAIARVYVGVQNSSSAVNGVTAVLHAARNGTELANSPITPFNRSFAASLNPNREQFEHTLNFQLPINWTTEGQLTLWAEVNPTQSVTEGNYNDNRSTDYNLTFYTVPPLQVVLIPVIYQKNGSGPIYRPNMNSRNSFGLGMLQRIFPIANIEYTVHSEYVFKGDMGKSKEWSRLLGEIDQLRLREYPSQTGRNTMPKYYGVLPMEASFWGGLGYVPGNSSIGLVEQDDVAAHEIGHNLGRPHVDCGNPSGPDPNYPYFNGAIGQVGLDVYQREVIPASEYKDIMSYCWDKWISDYNYEHILSALISQSRQNMSAKGSEDGLLISGRIQLDGTSSLNNVEAISNADLVVAPGLGSYRIELYDQSNIMQFSYAFDPVEIASEDNTPLPSDFGFVVPSFENLGSVQLWQSSTRLALLNAASAPPDLNTSVAAGSGADGNEVTIAWRVGSNRLSGSESPITVNVRYSPDDGQTWQTLAVQQTSDSSLSLNKTQLTASENGVLEIAAHNSTQSDIKRLELGPIGNKIPQVGIVSNSTAQLYPGEPLILTGAAMDLEDGSIADEKLVWSEARMGQLGTGPTLILSEGLSTGDYTITLTATDTNGSTAQDSLSITVQNENYQLYLPLIIE